jgi:tRNA-uridine 2-sulfurtransferase
VAEYAAARTPNPCIQCNTWLKFGKLFEYADSVGAEYVATGHHARIAGGGEADLPALCRGRDPGKDQSYVLFGVDRGCLGRILLPVGEYTKGEIRSLAERAGLRTAAKAESQEICFIPSGDHAAFVRSRSSHATPGEIVTTDGTVVGRHEGLAQFTVGQRKGLGVALGTPRYVVRLEAATGRVVLGSREELARRELTAAETNWLVDEPPGAFSCTVKIRYRSPAVPALVEPLPGQRMAVRFCEPCYGVAPGQAAVCYDGEQVLGGGWIES